MARGSLGDRCITSAHDGTYLVQVSPEIFHFSWKKRINPRGPQAASFQGDLRSFQACFCFLKIIFHSDERISNRLSTVRRARQRVLVTLSTCRVHTSVYWMNDDGDRAADPVCFDCVCCVILRQATISHHVRHLLCFRHCSRRFQSIKSPV